MPHSKENRKVETGKEYQEENVDRPSGCRNSLLRKLVSRRLRRGRCIKNTTWESRSHTTDVLLGS